MIKAAVLRVLGTKPVYGWLFDRAHRNRPLTILCYHTLGADDGGVNGWTCLRQRDFRRQLADLQAVYDIVSLDQALSDSRGKRPQAVITFDDGDCGLFTYLLPILEETGVPVTLYIATGQFEAGRAFWFDRVVNALQEPGHVSLDGVGTWELPGGGGKDHWAVLGAILETLKGIDPADRDAAADKIATQGRVRDTGERLGPMTREQLKILASTPGVTIGAHSHGHELLDQIPLEAARTSVARSRALLQDWTGQDVRHFAFPNGNHSRALCGMVRELGFASAVILEDRLAARGSDPFALPRVSVGRYDGRERLRLRLVGI